MFFLFKDWIFFSIDFPAAEFFIRNWTSTITNLSTAKVDVEKNSSRYTINTLKGEIDQNASATIGAESAASGKVVAVTRQPSHGSSAITARDLYYTPNPNFVGSDEILYTLNDGTNTSLEGKISIKEK